VTGNLNITSGTSTFGGSIAIHGSAGQTLSQIAADFNATDETTTSQNGGTALNNLGIHAQLSTDGTQIVFSQLSGTTNNVQAASVSTGTYSSPQVTDLTALTSSLTTSAPGDTLTGTLSGEKSDGSGTYSYSFADLTSSQIAANFNNTGSSNWSAAGISAAVNNSGNGNTITFTATGTGTISDNGSIVDTVGTKNVGESVSSAVVAGATLTATGSNSLLSGTLAGVGADGSTAWSQKFTDQTVAQIAAYFTANVGTIGIDVTVGGAGNNVITFAQDAGNSGTATFGTSAGPLTDVTPASQLTSTPQVVAGATLGALTATNAGDTLTGNLTVTSGITGKQSNLQLGISGQTDTLANLANTITNGGYGITAALNTSANSVAGTAAGTVLTFTQTAGDANTAAITNNGVVLDTAAAVSNPSLNVTAAGGGNIGTLTATSTSDILNGTLNLTEGNDALGNQTAYTITGQTLSEIAASFNAPGGANSGLGITAALNTSISNGNAVGTVLTFTSTGSHTAAVSGTGITDTTPATTINQTVAPGTILNTVTVANKADTLTGDFSLRQGLTSSVAAAGDIALSQGQTLAQIADDFNGGSGTGDATDKAALDVMGIHADLNAAGTELILTQEIGDKGTAIANTSTTSLVDTAGASTAATQSFGGDTLANTITVGASTDTLVGTLNIQEGVDTNKTASTYNLNGQTIAQVAAAFNTGAEKDLGILASVNNDVLTFSQASSDLGTAKVTASSSSIGDQAAATQTAQNVASGTMLDTLSVNSASDLLGGTLNLTSGVSGTAVPAITLGTKGTTDTLANLATTITNGGYGITATLNTARTELIFTQNSGGFSASVSSPSVTDSKSVSGVTPSTSLGTLTVSNSSDQLTGTLTGVEGDGQTAYSSIKLTGQTLAELASTINVTDAAYGITAQLNQAGTSLSFTATAGDTGAPTIGNVGSISDLTPAGMTSISLTNQPSAGQGYYSLGISGNVNDTSTAVTASGKTTYGGTANVGIATNHNGSSGTATISYSDAAGQSLSSTDLSNATDAQATLKALNAAITDVAAQDGYVGAQINTLNAVSSVLSTQQENVVSAQNAVQATDYAQAASNMSKYQILSQTGISALAQANSMQQEVTKLLQ
jgi:flagellin